MGLKQTNHIVLSILGMFFLFTTLFKIKKINYGQNMNQTKKSISFLLIISQKCQQLAMVPTTKNIK
jgi:hypothetical protein